MNTDQIFEKSKQSARGMWILNKMLHRMIPFNKPHRLEVVKLDAEETIVQIPYYRKNLNHLKGIHACALITGAEYCSGLVLLQHLSPDKYRLIMKDLKVVYHYQAKMESTAKFGLAKNDLFQTLGVEFEETGIGLISCHIPVYDEQKNLICDVTINWQIKDWQKVKTKV